MKRRTVQPEIRSFDSVLWSSVTPFDRSKTKNANRFKDCNAFGNGKCELSAIQEGRKRCKFLAKKVQNSSPILTSIFLQGKVQNSPPISALLRWRHFSLFLSLSLCISLSLSLSLSPSAPHPQYRKRFRASYNKWKSNTLITNKLKFWSTFCGFCSLQKKSNLCGSVEYPKHRSFIQLQITKREIC